MSELSAHRVDRIVRDATGKKSKKSTASTRAFISRGKIAAESGVPRYNNPEVATPARAWTYGWNMAHGICRGCKLCGEKIGTRKQMSYSDWLKRYHY
jgi:hypothetical protein